MRVIIMILSVLLTVPAALSAQASRELDYSILTAENHPRLFFSAADFSAIRSGAVENPVFNTFSRGIISEAEAYIGAPDIERVLEGKRMLDVSRNAFRRLFYCAYAYKATGDVRFLQQAEHDLRSVCGFENWNARRHFLDVGEMATGVAIAYDWLYSDLSEECRALVRKALIDFAFHPAENGVWNLNFYKFKNNWNQVCNGGLICAALAVYEDYPEGKMLIERGIESNRKVVDYIYSPDGNYPEGYSYWRYGTAYQAIMLTAMETALGTDAGISEHPGFRKTPEFMLFMEGSTGLCFNFADTYSDTSPAYPQWYFAYKLNDVSILYQEKDCLDEYCTSFDSRMMLLSAYYAYKLNLTSPDAIKAPSRKVYNGNGETPVVLVHDSWTNDENDKYLGIKGGRARTSHAHMDAGSFVYEAYGVRWTADINRIGYGELEAAGIDLWNMDDGSSRWSLPYYNNMHHNTLTINGKYHKVDGFAPVLEVIDTEDRKGAVIDLTAPLAEVKSAVRTAFIEGEELVVLDEISTEKGQDAEVQWTIVTLQKPGIVGRRLRLTASNGRAMDLKITVKGCGKPELWCTSDYVVNDNYACGYRLRLKGGSRAKVTVRFTPAD